MSVKKWYYVAVFIVLLSDAQSASAAQPLELDCSGKKLNLSKIDRVGKSALGRPEKRKGLRVGFRLEDNQVFEIATTPKKERGLRKVKPGAHFSYQAAPLALRVEGREALNALADAKLPVVLSPCDEKVSVRSTRSELFNALARQNAPKKIAAAQVACEEVLGRLKIAAVTATRIGTITRADAFREKSKK